MKSLNFRCKINILHQSKHPLSKKHMYMICLRPWLVHAPTQSDITKFIKPSLVNKRKRIQPPFSPKPCHLCQNVCCWVCFSVNMDCLDPSNLRQSYLRSRIIDFSFIFIGLLPQLFQRFLESGSWARISLSRKAQATAVKVSVWPRAHLHALNRFPLLFLTRLLLQLCNSPS